jgi:hypothetical protein
LKHTIFLLFFAINLASCQNVQDNAKNFEIIKDSNSWAINTNDDPKKHSKKEAEDLRFSKELASNISKDVFKKIDKVVITKETAAIKKKDTINYIVYDFMPKKEFNIESSKNSLSFGKYFIGLYKWPITCNTFQNENRITCVCKIGMTPELLTEESFISYIKSKTEYRLQNSLKK